MTAAALLLALVMSAPFSADSVKASLNCPGWNQGELHRMAQLPVKGAVPLGEALQGLERLLKKLAAQGYPLALVDSIVVNSGRLDAYLSPGAKAVVGMVTESSAQSDTLAGGGRLGLTEAELQRQAFDILDRWTNLGFPFASVTCRPRVRLERDRVVADLDYRVTGGNFCRIRSVSFPGRRLTQERALRLETRLKREAPVTRRGLQQAIERLRRLPQAASVGEARLRQVLPGIVDIEIPVNEQAANRFSGLAALSPQDDRPTGNLDLSFANILGTGRKLLFSWDGISRIRRGVRLQYTEPWILSLPLAAAAGFERWSGDSLGSMTRFSGRVDWEFADRVVLSGGYTGETLEPPEAGSALKVIRSRWVEGGVESDRRDRLWNPSQGARLSVKGGLGRRRGALSGEGWLERREFSFETVTILSRWWRLALAGYERGISGDALYSGELPSIGGSASVRGYPEEHRLGRSVAAGTAELRWRPDAGAYLAAFADVGGIVRSDPRWEGGGALASLGVGGGWENRAGRFTLAVALARGEPIGQARLHARFESRF